MSVLIMAGCNSAEPPAAKDDQGQSTPTLFDTQLDSLDKAKAVEQSVQDAVKDRDRQMQDKGI